VDLDMEMLLTLGMMEIWWRHSLLHKRGVGDDDGGDFPKEEASEQQYLASPVVGEDFRLCHGLCKSWKNMA
jgi:hypothetical protein